MIGNWILELFQENAEIFIKFVEKIWEKARDLARSLDRLFKELCVDRDSRILEIGCGNGRVLINLAEIGYRNLVGVDISAKLVQDAYKRAKTYKVDKYIDLIAGDARTIGNLLRRESVKVIMFIWTTIIGYYDKETDYRILKQRKEIAKENTYLLILEHSNRDWIAYLHDLLEKITTIYKLDNIVIIEETTYNKEKATLNTMWTIYKEENKNLKYIKQIKITIKLYTIHELIELTEKAGWKHIKTYSEIQNMIKFKTLSRCVNIIFGNWLSVEEQRKGLNIL